MREAVLKIVLRKNMRAATAAEGHCHETSCSVH